MRGTKGSHFIVFFLNVRRPLSDLATPLLYGACSFKEELIIDNFTCLPKVIFGNQGFYGAQNGENRIRRLLKTRGGMHFNNIVYRKMIRPATMKSKTDNLWG